MRTPHGARRASPAHSSIHLASALAHSSRTNNHHPSDGPLGGHPKRRSPPAPAPRTKHGNPSFLRALPLPSGPLDSYRHVTLALRFCGRPPQLHLLVGGGGGEQLVPPPLAPPLEGGGGPREARDRAVVRELHLLQHLAPASVSIRRAGGPA
eukprot:1194747-Prorocentrum_minimum.AAC.1